MPNPNYQAGARAELNAVKELRNLGYEAQRSAASHGIFDLYAIHPEGLHVIFIQCKRGGKPSPSEYKSAVEAKVPADAIKMVLWYPVGQAPRVLYYNRLPEWLTDGGNGTAPKVRWFIGLPPKQSTLSMRPARTTKAKTAE